MNGMQIFKEIGIKICNLKVFYQHLLKQNLVGLKTMLESASSYGGMRTLNSLLEVLQK